MAKLKFRYLTVVLLLLATSAVVHALQHSQEQDGEAGLANLRYIPMQVSKWQGEEFPLEERIYDILETRAIIHRSFRSSEGENVFLSVVHYHDTKVDFHQPESCLGGIGLKTEKTTKAVSLRSGDETRTFNLARLVSTHQNGKSLVYYFYKAGPFIGSNYTLMRLNIAANKMMRNDTKGSLIRISTELIPGRENNAETLLLGFLQDLFPYIEKTL